MESKRTATTYFIPPGKFLLMENALGNPDLIQSSVSSDCRVTIVDLENFPLDDLEQWPTFRLISSDIKLKLGEGKYHIYIVVPAADNTESTSAFVSYNTRLVDRKGYAQDGTFLGKAGFRYYPCGTVSERGGNPSAATTPSGQGRIVEMDLGVTPTVTNLPGNLSDLEEVFQIEKTDPSNPSSWLMTIVGTVKSMTARIIRVTSSLIFGSGESERPLVGVAVRKDSTTPGMVSDTIIATTAWVDAQFEHLDDRYLSKQKDDSTPFNLGVGKSLSVGEDLEVKGSASIQEGLSIGGNIESKDFAEGTEKGGYAIRKNSEEQYEVESDNIIARILAKTYDLLVQNHATFVGDLSSEEFISGFLSGKGWSIRMKEFVNAAGVAEKKSVAEFDDLIVRGSMRIYEFIVSQLLGENDNRIFTGMMEVDHYDAVSGKVYLKTDGGRLYNPFRVDDVIIVQQYGGMPSQDNGYYVTKQYEFIVTGTGVGEAGEDRLDWVTFRNFTTSIEGGDESLIAERDTLVRLDNISDTSRKGIIQLMSVGEDTPYMDFIYGAKTDPENSLKGRFGNLGGVYNPLFGWLKEFGAYLTNLYAVGEFVIAHTGENVSDSISIAKGQFRTNYRQTTYDMTEEDNFFTNAAMTDNCKHWTLGSDVTEYFLVDDLPQFFNYDLYASGKTYAGLSEWKGRDMLRLNQSSIMQSNGLIDKAGTHKVYTGYTENADGSYTDTYEEVPDTLYLSVRFFVAVSGKVEFGFVGSDGKFINNDFHYVSDATTREDGYEVKLSGTWDGIGDFCITSTGDVYIDLLSLTDRPLDNFMITTSTAIEQDATRISLLGKKVNGVQKSVTDLGIELNAAEERITAYVNKEIDGVSSTVSELQIEVDGISATVSKISFDSNGNVTNINKSGLMLESNFASMFATQVTRQGVAKTAEIKTYVDEQISGIEISADQINISANDYISIINKGTTTINAARLDLSGLVTVTSLNTTLSGYATDSELSAAQSALNTSISNLNTTLSAQINAKASTESLNAKVSELNTAISKKADTSSLGSVAYMNDIANAACNGSTLIVGGYINADLLKVEKIYAKEGTIGDFSISETTLSVEGSYTSANLLGNNNYSTTIEANRFAVNVNGGEFSSSFGLNGSYVLETSSWYLAAMSVYSGGASRRSDDVCAIHATLDKSDIGLYINGGSSYLKASSGKTISINGLSLLATRSFSGTADTNMDILIVSGTAKLPSASSCQGKMYFTKILSGSLTVQNVYISDSTGITSSGTWTDANARLFFSDGTYWYEINGV